MHEGKFQVLEFSSCNILQVLKIQWSWLSGSEIIVFVPSLYESALAAPYDLLSSLLSDTRSTQPLEEKLSFEFTTR